MRRWGKARVLYAVAAALVLCGTGMFLGPRSYACSSAESGAFSSCGDVIAADLISHAIVAAIGLGTSIYLIVKAVRATPRR